MKSYALAIVYILISLFVGECHPFTRVPMYNSFPNYAYAFYLADSTDKPAFFYKYISSDLSHQYFSIAQRLNIRNGHQVETSEELTRIGKIMMENIINNDSKNFPKGRMELRRVAFAFEGDSIVKKDLILYTASND